MALTRTGPVSAAVLCLLIACVSAYDNGLAAVPPMGWNTWCTDDICGALEDFYLARFAAASDPRQVPSTAAMRTRSRASPMQS